jgi:serine/threonine-protein kinase HipA
MTFQPVSVVHVYLTLPAGKVSMGRLALNGHQLFFEYDPAFLKQGLDLSPFKLPLKPGLIACEDRIFDGLFGVFNDSLPDGWGRLLLDRKLMQRGMNPDALSPLDRLCYVGSRGMGALTYEPENEGTSPEHQENLDVIAHEVLQFQEHHDDRFVDELLTLNGSSAGARPKIVVAREQQDWIIKFPSSLDPHDIGPIEYAYHLMAKDACLEVPTAKLFPSQKGPGYFGVQRFDRVKGRHFHMHTVSGLLHADHRSPTLDYESIMKATSWLTKSTQECEKQFRAAVFNVIGHNRDDHAKNFSFLMDGTGKWQVSPAYDLTFSSGPRGEHCSTLMGEGKRPALSHLLKLATIGGIEIQNALQIIDDVRAAISKWSPFATASGVSPASSARIQRVLNTVGV